MGPKAIRWLQAKIRTEYKKIPRSYMPEGHPNDIAWSAARVGYGKYKCASCSGIFGPDDMHKDHIDPIINPLVGPEDWNTWFSRLEGPIQILCITCHKAKSKEEVSIRAATRRKQKCLKK